MERDCQSSFIELSISCLMDVNENVNASQFEVICYHSQILNTTMIRMNSIAPLLNDLVNTAKVEILEDRHSFIPQELIVLIREKGEMGVWTYLSGLPMEELNSDLILRLDAVRSAARYPTNKTDWFMNKIINIPMKTEC